MLQRRPWRARDGRNHRGRDSYPTDTVARRRIAPIKGGVHNILAGVDATTAAAVAAAARAVFSSLESVIDIEIGYRPWDRVIRYIPGIFHVVEAPEREEARKEERKTR